MRKIIRNMLLGSIVLCCSTPIYSFFGFDRPIYSDNYTDNDVNGGLFGGNLIGGLFGGSSSNDSQYQSFRKPKNRYSFKSLQKMGFDQFLQVLNLIDSTELDKHTKKFEAKLEKYQDKIDAYTKKLAKDPNSEKYQNKLNKTQNKHNNIKRKLDEMYAILIQVAQSPPMDQPVQPIESY